MNDDYSAEREVQIEALWLQFQGVFLQVLSANHLISKRKPCLAASTLLEAYRNDFISRIASIPPPLPVPSAVSIRDREEAKMFALINAYKENFGNADAN